MDHSKIMRGLTNLFAKPPIAIAKALTLNTFFG